MGAQISWRWWEQDVIDLVIWEGRPANRAMEADREAAEERGEAEEEAVQDEYIMRKRYLATK